MNTILEKLDKLQKTLGKQFAQLTELDLGWFSNQEDESNKQKAIKLAERGWFSCKRINQVLRDELNGLRPEEIQEIMQAITQNRPYSGLKKKHVALITILLQLGVYFLDVGANTAFQLGLGIGLIGALLTVGIEIFKTSSNCKMAKEYLKLQRYIIKLENIAK